MAVDVGVEQHRADGEPDRDVGGAFERHVDRPVGHLRRGAGQVDDQAVVLLGDGDDDRQLLLAGIVAVEIAVDRRLGAIDAVGQPGDRLAHQPLGMIHQRLAGELEGLEAVALDQLDHALGADPRGRDLGVHVADHEVGGADVVAHDLPDHLVLHAAVVDLDRLELQALGIGVDRLDDAARAGRQRADVEMMRRRCGEGDQASADEHRHDEGDVRAVAGAGIGVVVHDDVAGADHVAALLQRLQDAADVARDRPRLQRRRLRRFGEAAALGIDQRRAEILRLADDRGVAHAHQLVAHLDRDVLERALDHRGGDRVDPVGLGRGLAAGRCSCSFSFADGLLGRSGRRRHEERLWSARPSDASRLPDDQVAGGVGFETVLRRHDGRRCPFAG